MYGNIPVNEKHLKKSAQWMREYWAKREAFDRALGLGLRHYSNPRTQEMVDRMVEQGAERLSR